MTDHERVRMPLDGGHMDVCLSPGASPETVAALQAIGQAAVNQMTVGEALHNLCCVCGTISLDRDWTYWQRNQDEATEVETPWMPSQPGESDPMARCPACKWEHQDTDDGSGFYTGTLAEMEEQRAKDEPECADWWAESLREARA